MQVKWDDLKSERYGKSRRGRGQGRKASNKTNGVGFLSIGKCGIAVLENAISRVKKAAEISAQHGSVKVIMKDGKYIE